ncbi:hypothetical protein FJ364_01335 [Candidatus Dependentiae bacterium]|nr:hypothetical protein [Candidatus Dependentiae bacterium]
MKRWFFRLCGLMQIHLFFSVFAANQTFFDDEHEDSFLYQSLSSSSGIDAKIQSHIPTIPLSVDIDARYKRGYKVCRPDVPTIDNLQEAQQSALVINSFLYEIFFPALKVIAVLREVLDSFFKGSGAINYHLYEGLLEDAYPADTYGAEYCQERFFCDRANNGEIVAIDVICNALSRIMPDHLVQELFFLKRLRAQEENACKSYAQTLFEVFEHSFIAKLLKYQNLIDGYDVLLQEELFYRANDMLGQLVQCIILLKFFLQNSDGKKGYINNPELENLLLNNDFIMGKIVRALLVLADVFDEVDEYESCLQEHSDNLVRAFNPSMKDQPACVLKSCLKKNDKAGEKAARVHIDEQHSDPSYKEEKRSLMAASLQINNPPTSSAVAACVSACDLVALQEAMNTALISNDQSVHKKEPEIRISTVIIDGSDDSFDEEDDEYTLPFALSKPNENQIV